MEYIFESVTDQDDYEQVVEKIFYQENKEKLSVLYTEEQFKVLPLSTKKKIGTELKLNLYFILTFGTAITAFFPIVESFIVNSGISNINLDMSTVVYLGICALSIVFKKPKEEYRKIFSELRLRNVYGLLRDLVTFTEKMEELFNYISSKVKEVTYDIFGMFNYTVLFVPFALTMAGIFSDDQVSLSSFVSAIESNGFMKLSTIAIGLTGVTVREVVEKILSKLPKFTFRSYKKYLSKSFSEISMGVRRFISKLKLKMSHKTIKKDLDEREKEISVDIKNNDDDILKWDQWKKENDIDPNTEPINEEQ